MSMFAENMGVNVIRVDAESRFLDGLAGVSDLRKNEKLSAIRLSIFSMNLKKYRMLIG